MNKYTLVPYSDADHNEYIQCQINAFEKYILEFYGKLDICIMEEHLNLLKSHLFIIKIEGKSAGYVYYYEADDKITIDVFTILPEFRNMGLGSIIMQDFIKTAD